MIKDDGVQDDGSQDDVLLPAVVLGGHHIIRAEAELWPVVLVHPHAGVVQVLQGGGGVAGSSRSRNLLPGIRHKGQKEQKEQKEQEPSARRSIRSRMSGRCRENREQKEKKKQGEE